MNSNKLSTPFFAMLYVVKPMKDYNDKSTNKLLIIDNKPFHYHTLSRRQTFYTIQKVPSSLYLISTEKSRRFFSDKCDCYFLLAARAGIIIDSNNTKQVQIKAELKARAVCEQQYELRGFQCYKQSNLDSTARTTWVSSVSMIQAERSGCNSTNYVQ